MCFLYYKTAAHPTVPVRKWTEELHPFKRAGIWSSKHKHVFFRFKNVDYRHYAWDLPSICFQKDKAYLVYAPCAYHQSVFPLKWSSMFSSLPHAKRPDKGEWHHTEVFGGWRGGSWLKNKKKKGNKRPLSKHPRRDFLTVITCYIFRSVLNIMHWTFSFLVKEHYPSPLYISVITESQ